MKFKPAVPKEYEWIVADALLNQATPGTGTKYEVLAETRNVRIIGITIVCTWTVQPTPLECWVTVDDEQIRFRVDNPISATQYRCEHNLSGAPTSQSLTAGYIALLPFLCEGKKVKVEAEITAGTVSNLGCRVKYQVKRP